MNLGHSDDGPKQHKFEQGEKWGWKRDGFIKHSRSILNNSRFQGAAGAHKQMMV